MSPTILFAEVPQLYAAIERSDDPALADRPVLVGGNPRKRGMVQAATLDALAAGVTLEMTMLEALQLCPRARAVRTDMPRYREVSRRLMATLRRVVGRLEPLGLGAAYADVSGAGESVEAIAARLVERVAEEPGLPLRVGIGSRKFVARLAAETAGESGIRRVSEAEERAFLDPQPVTRLEGVGAKTAARLAERGVRTIADVVALGREVLEEAFGAHGLRIHALAVGDDPEPLRAASHPQSLSREATLGLDRLDWAVLAEQLQRLAQDLEAELRRQGLAARRVVLRLRFGDGASASRSLTVPSPLVAAGDLHQTALRLLERVEAGERAVRRVGLQLGRLAPAAESDRQLALFPPGD